MIEGGIWKKIENQVPFSAQEIIDYYYSQVEINIGCKGGNMPNSFDYVIENNGMLNEECYKFEDKDQSCQTDKYNKTCERTEIRGIFNVSQGDEDDQAIGLINYGRVGAGIDISASDFKQYRSEQKKEFWVIQNSLGISWGENGLMQLARHSQDRCGISSYAFAAVV
ncbi:MAG: putative cathepsin K [Streblomastix strix]|uniref:Putative cathepsin K n=1 Tax=Streblomastix strix TaxID=222440 RepID=A0A5J4VY89_9EUKA|nr:MAG: putative cathepsin K [Streblomastix strix]